MRWRVVQDAVVMGAPRMLTLTVSVLNRTALKSEPSVRDKDGVLCGL